MLAALSMSPLLPAASASSVSRPCYSAEHCGSHATVSKAATYCHRQRHPIKTKQSHVHMSEANKQFPPAYPYSPPLLSESSDCHCLHMLCFANVTQHRSRYLESSVAATALVHAWRPKELNPRAKAKGFSAQGRQYPMHLAPE